MPGGHGQVWFDNIRLDNRVVVPNVVGQPCANAPGIITAVDNLVVGNVTYAYSLTVAADTVISQDPAAGTPVSSGSAVDYVCSLGIAPPSQIWYPKIDHDINVTVVWTPVTGATSYKLERTADINGVGGGWAQVFDGCNSGNYRFKVDNNGLTAGTHYRYRVKSENAAR